MFTTTTDVTRSLGTDTRTDFALRAPDFVDEVANTAAWIGERAAVEIDLDDLAYVRPVTLLARMYTGSKRFSPEHFGIQVSAYADVVLADGTEIHADGVNRWHLVRETCGVAEV